MPRTGENIYRRKDGRWEGRTIKTYGADGKVKYKSVYGNSYRQVKQKLESAMLEQPQTSLQRTFLEKPFAYAASCWLHNSRIRVKESTYAQYSTALETHILPYLGKYPIGKIGVELIENYVNRLLVQGKVDGNGGLASKTVQDIFVIIKSIFKYTNHPALSGLDHIKLKKDEKETRILTHQEVSKLTEFLFTSTDLTKLGVLLSLYTGIRIGELCALRWENINLAEQTLAVKSTMQRMKNINATNGIKTKVTITAPKSKCAIRNIPLPEFLFPLLKQFIGHPKAFVLTGNSERYIEPRTMQNRFKAYAKQLGMVGANYHALRHTFITRCVELDFEIKSLSEIAGHANVNITLSRYVHSSFALKRTQMDKLTALRIYSPSESPSKMCRIP